MHRWFVVVWAAAMLAACDQYKEPSSPRDVQPLTTRDRGMAWSGIDYAGTGDVGSGREQRNGTAGVNSDTNDDQVSEASAEDRGPPAGSGVFGPGTGILQVAPGRGSTTPTADLDEPEMRNAQRGGIVFRPSDHYYVSGVDMGPSWDAAPGAGGPGKSAMKQP
ncbi:MAG TPA: hypothetical protein VMH40_12280 [Myxococcaceae bacterium]|nr:hypothetical protein [Myxococcaceae bacterium]